MLPLTTVLWSMWLRSSTTMSKTSTYQVMTAKEKLPIRSLIYMCNVSFKCFHLKYKNCARSIGNDAVLCKCEWSHCYYNRNGSKQQNKWEMEFDCKESIYWCMRNAMLSWESTQSCAPISWWSIFCSETAFKFILFKISLFSRFCQD